MLSGKYTESIATLIILFGSNIEEDKLTTPVEQGGGAFVTFIPINLPSGCSESTAAGRHWRKGGAQ